MGVAGQPHAPAASTPGKEPVPIVQEAGWAENLIPIGIRSRTFQPVVSRYTDWATRPTPLILTSVHATTQAKMQCIDKVYVHLLDTRTELRFPEVSCNSKI